MSIKIIVSLLFKFVAFLLSGAILKPYRFFVRKNEGSVKKVEVQEALPPAGVIGAEPLTLVPQHFSRKPA